jgi:hypothetical protein
MFEAVDKIKIRMVDLNDKVSASQGRCKLVSA